MWKTIYNFTNIVDKWINLKTSYLKQKKMFFIHNVYSLFAPCKKVIHIFCCYLFAFLPFFYANIFKSLGVLLDEQL